MSCRQVCKNYICKISSCVTTRCQAVGRAASLYGPDTSHNYSIHHNALQADRKEKKGQCNIVKQKCINIYNS